MILSFAQLQIAASTAPALMALLFLPGVTLNHPALIARTMAAAPVCSLAEVRCRSLAQVGLRAACEKPSKLTVGRLPAKSIGLVQRLSSDLQLPIGYSGMFSLSCRAP